VVLISHTLVRLAAGGIAAAALVAAAAPPLERARFGADDREALGRIEREVRARFEDSSETLTALASRVAAFGELLDGGRRDEQVSRRLFDVVADAVPDEAAGRTGITVYDAAAVPVAWDGRVSELPRERIEGRAALFVAPALRLVRVEPVSNPAGTRLGTVAVEQQLGEINPAPGTTDTFVLPTAIAPVSLRARFGGTAARSAYSFDVPLRDGQLLVEAEVSPADLAEARARWRGRVRAASLSIASLTLLLFSGPLLEMRRRARSARPFASATAALTAALAAARAVLWAALVALDPAPETADAVNLLLNGLLLVALVWLALDLVERRRTAKPRSHLLSIGAEALGRTMPLFFAAGASGAALLWAYARFVQSVVARTSVDVLQFSLYPLTGRRLTIAFGLVLLHAGVFWCAALAIRMASIFSRRARSRWSDAAAAASWATGAAVATVVARQVPGPAPIGPLLLSLAGAGAAAFVLGQPRGRVRRASQAARLLALYVALLAPALTAYPSLNAFATEAKERRIASEFGPQATTQRDELQQQLSQTLVDIDAMKVLPDLVAGLSEEETPATDPAFTIWSATPLKTSRLTSAIELYGPKGRLLSRFALNLPEYTVTTHVAAGCSWAVFEEGSPLGSSERRILRASRGICRGRRLLASIVVRAMLDYRAVPFMSAQTPYIETLPTGTAPSVRGEVARDVEFVVYGWSRAPLHMSGTSVWPIPDAVFDRMVQSRDPFWANVSRGGETFRVYLLNDRGGIYALGYPVRTAFGHLVNLAELVVLVAVLYATFFVLATMLSTVFARTPASGRALLREVRSSFYWKLFIAFVVVAVLPVVVLAVVTRTYFATQLRAGVEEAAVQTATVAQRLVEDFATLQQRGAGALELVDDQIMVLVGRAIDQDVNLFERERLQATSERDLFASGLLTTRTPGPVYRSIVLDRMPTFVGEEQVGDVSYLLAAAPVRAAGREGIVTVPQTLRRFEIERQIDELDRSVLFASVLFVLLGAGLGYWMAERIADPVNRLTRATRRIARGDLDARIAATSSDELRRLVEDFNRMAADLKRQRSELERTQRLEAWADMARQVAHDIKNPLTPIQLSAEHARRVNQDRGGPLSPVLDECVTAILTQVKLLRQISAEFSSFASSPTARPERTDLPRLIEEVIEPYRTGLSGRIAIDVSATPPIPAISIDRTLFARALTNVVENALHAMPAQGRLTIDTSAGETHVVVRIADTGVGMDPESVTRIFEPYFSTKASGTGLGLTIAKRNVELNGGTIGVESERGRGTTVTLTLPAGSQPEAAEARSLKPGAPEA
jgi:signal transduction histidine kinase